MGGGSGGPPLRTGPPLRSGPDQGPDLGPAAGPLASGGRQRPARTARGPDDRPGNTHRRSLSGSAAARRRPLFAVRPVGRVMARREALTYGHNRYGRCGRGGCGVHTVPAASRAPVVSVSQRTRQDAPPRTSGPRRPCPDSESPANLGTVSATLTADQAIHFEVDRIKVPIRDLLPVHLQVEGWTGLVSRAARTSAGRPGRVRARGTPTGPSARRC